MSQRFRVEATFNHEVYFIKMNVATIEAKDQAEAEAYAGKMNVGKIFYKKGFKFLFHETTKGMSVLFDNHVNTCGILKPENKELTFLELLHEVNSQLIERNKHHEYFESISFEVSPSLVRS